MEFRAAGTMRGALEEAKGKKEKIGVYLEDGSILTGLITDVGDHLVVLSSLAGKEFYDALIRIENISALEARAR